MFNQLVKDRMQMLGYDEATLAQKTFFDLDFINDILIGKIKYEALDSFDLEVLANALLCDVHYFDDDAARSNDVVFSSRNRGIDTKKSNLAKAKIQFFMKDLAMIKEAMQ